MYFRLFFLNHLNLLFPFAVFLDKKCQKRLKSTYIPLLKGNKLFFQTEHKIIIQSIISIFIPSPLHLLEAFKIPLRHCKQVKKILIGFRFFKIL